MFHLKIGSFEVTFGGRPKGPAQESDVRDVVIVKETPRIGGPTKQEWGRRPQAVGKLPARRIMSIERAQSPVEMIVFPACRDVDDPWERQRFDNMVNVVEKMFGRGWIDIVAINDIIKEFRLCLTVEALDSHRKLSMIHCVDFTKLDRAIVPQIPHLLTHVFSEGRIPPPWEAEVLSQ